MIALSLLLGYSATVHFAPALAFVWVLAFGFAGPWLVNSSLRFNARNTSYRNIRFNFTGTYGAAFGVYVLWPILAVITLFTTYPLARRARDQYNINHHVFGGKYFHAEIPGGAMYHIYGLAVLLFLAFVAVAALIYSGLHVAPLNPKNSATMVPLILVFGGAYMFSLLFLLTFIGTKVFNLAVSRTVLAEHFQLESTLSPPHMTWLAFSNLVLVLLTLGLFYPWAKTRVAHYRAAHFAITGPAEVDGFMSELATGQGAIGEEIASFFDIDIGL
jgi:uncharacterized membrane protein YjgN (DUF898 family)